jgi:hypothetical protein
MFLNIDIWKNKMIILILQVNKKIILMQSANCFPFLAMNGFLKYNWNFVINKTLKSLVQFQDEVAI